MKQSEEVMGLDVSQHGEGYLSWVKEQNGVHSIKDTPKKMVTTLSFLRTQKLLYYEKRNRKLISTFYHLHSS